jgi:hypothetical protein
MPPQGVYKGMPFLRVRDLGGSPQGAAEQLAAMVHPERRCFYYQRTILKTAGWHKEVADRLVKLEPAARIVDPHTFFALLERYERDKKRYPKPSWTRARVLWEAGKEDGLRLVPFTDGPISVREIAGRKAAISRVKGSSALYIYASVHDGFPAGSPETLLAEVTYLDAGENRFCVHYNGPSSAYEGSRWVDLKGTGRWKTAEIRLKEAQLANQQNAGCDLRLVNLKGTLAVSRIVLRRDDPKDAASSP